MEREHHLNLLICLYPILFKTDLKPLIVFNTVYTLTKGENALNLKVIFFNVGPTGKNLKTTCSPSRNILILFIIIL